MGIEIERKFLVREDSWRSDGDGMLYRQGYLCAGPERTVRVRLAGGRGYLTVKGGGAGARRYEFEYEIPPEDARDMLEKLCLHPLIDKMRYRVQVDGETWEVDEFLGENQGLVVAEIELAHEDQPFSRPPWLGREVTGDVRYYNARLFRHPYSSWRREEP